MPRSTDAEIRQRYGLAPDATVRRAQPDADGQVRLSPDSFTVVEMDSALEWGTWDRPIAVAGYSARLTVQGTFVGEGAPVDVTLKDARNRRAGQGRAAMHRDRAIVEVEIDRRTAENDPDGVLAAADVEIQDLGLAVVSAPLLVLPFAELVDTRWSAERAAQGDAVTLSCRIEGSPGGVERLGREPAEVAVFVHTASGAAALDEPVASFRADAGGGRIEVTWEASLGLDRWTLLSQSELDVLADQAGAPRGQNPYAYDRPHLVFRVRLAGIEAESGPLAIDDWVEMSHQVSDQPAADVPYVLTLADGSEREGTLDSDGSAREEGLPPGPVLVRYDPSDAPPPPDEDDPDDFFLD